MYVFFMRAFCLLSPSFCARPLHTASLLAWLTLSLTPAAWAGTGALNDTGQTQAYVGAGGLLDCNIPNAGDAATYPGQDCRYGRDAATAGGTLTKIGGGPAGFDWTPLDNNGNPIAIVNGVPASPPACVRDNVTGLIWEGKSDSGVQAASRTFTWFNTDSATNAGNQGQSSPPDGDTEKYAAKANLESWCGVGQPWRVPTRRELLSIMTTSNGPTGLRLDPWFFPNAVNGVPGASHWTSDNVRSNNVLAWCIEFSGAYIIGCGKNFYIYLRLVRNVQ